MAQTINVACIVFFALSIASLWLGHRIRWSDKFSGDRGFVAYHLLFYTAVGLMGIAFVLAVWSALLVRGGAN